MERNALVTREQEHQTATSLYGDNENLAELFEAVKRVAPWANDKQFPMSNNEIGLAIRRSVAMGLDPLNQHEVQIWKDRRGTVNFQLAYTLIAEWVRHFHGEHTEPQYHRLGVEELTAEGLQESDMAFSVTFLMKKDIASLGTLVEAGYDARQARAMLEIGGLGVAKSSEYTGQYFAPAGRSPAWKVKKRALTDAYRRKFGTPTRSDIEALRRAGGMADVKPQDWSDVQELNPGDAAALAKDTARHRDHQERLTDDPEYRAEFDETVKAAESLMYPAPEEPQTVDAEFAEMPEELEATHEDGPDFEDGSQDEPTDAGIDLWDAEERADTGGSKADGALMADLPPDAPVTSWSQFKDYAVDALGYDHGNHLVGALRKERGTDKTDVFWNGARPMLVVDGVELLNADACRVIWRLAYEHKQA